MRFLPALFLSLLFSIPAFATAPAAKSETVFDRILRTGVLRCGYIAWEPMIIVDPNTKAISGISHDLIDEVAKRLSLKIEWVEETTWAEYPQGLATGRFDVMCNSGYANSQRSRIVAFTDPILYSPVNVYAKTDSPHFGDDKVKLNSPDTRIVFIDGTTMQLVVEEGFPLAKHITLPASTPFSDVFMQLSTGKADAFAMDAATANRMIKANDRGVQAVPGAKNVRVFPNVFAVKKGEVDLQQALNTVLSEINSVGITERIVQKYEPEPGTYYRLAPAYTVSP